MPSSVQHRPVPTPSTGNSNGAAGTGRTGRDPVGREGFSAALDNLKNSMGSAGSRIGALAEVMRQAGAAGISDDRLETMLGKFYEQQGQAGNLRQDMALARLFLSGGQ